LSDVAVTLIHGRKCSQPSRLHSKVGQGREATEPSLYCRTQASRVGASTVLYGKTVFRVSEFVIVPQAHSSGDTPGTYYRVAISDVSLT
jgi:hypothetical protein